MHELLMAITGGVPVEEFIEALHREREALLVVIQQRLVEWLDA